MFLFSLKLLWLQRPLLNDWERWTLKCRPCFEDSVEMEQLTSHLREGRHEYQLHFTYSRALLSSVISLIVLPTLPSPSSALLLLKGPYCLRNVARRTQLVSLIRNTQLSATSASARLSIELDVLTGVVVDNENSTKWFVVCSRARQLYTIGEFVARRHLRCPLQVVHMMPSG